MTNKATTAAEWADDANTMLVTYNRRPSAVVAFARRHGALGGFWVDGTRGLTIRAENGWTVAYDRVAQRFVV